SGGQFAPALTGAAFLDTWGGTPLEQVLDYMRSSMPPARAGALSDETYAALLALILQANGSNNHSGALPAGRERLALAGLALPPPPPVGVRGGAGVGGPSGRTVPPASPQRPSRLANLPPVTAGVLAR